MCTYSAKQIKVENREPINDYILRSTYTYAKCLALYVFKYKFNHKHTQTYTLGRMYILYPEPLYFIFMFAYKLFLILSTTYYSGIVWAHLWQNCPMTQFTLPESLQWHAAQLAIFLTIILECLDVTLSMVHMIHGMSCMSLPVITMVRPACKKHSNCYDKDITKSWILWWDPIRDWQWSLQINQVPYSGYEIVWISYRLYKMRNG